MTDDDAIRDILTKIVHRAARPKESWQYRNHGAGKFPPL